MTVEPTDKQLAMRRQVADALIAEPERYDQDVFGTKIDCGTAHCIAGWAMILADYTVTFRGNPDDSHVEWARPDGSFVECEYRDGGHLLGLSMDQAVELFSPNWKADEQGTATAAAKALTDMANDPDRVTEIIHDGYQRGWKLSFSEDV